MKHVKTVSRTPGTASTVIDTVSESKIEAKESLVNGKSGGL